MIDPRLFGILLICAIAIPPAFAQEKTGTLEVFIKNESNDWVVPEGLTLKIFKDLEAIPLKEISPPESNPIVIPSLDLGHRYKVEVYMNSMYADVGFVDLQKSQDKLEITIKNTGGMRLNIFYKDAETPLAGAMVWIKSHDGKSWAYSDTDLNGNTARTWLYPVVKEGNYYYAEISLGPNLKYIHSPIKLQPNTAQEFKIVTKWPTIVDKLITVEVYNSTKNKVTTQDGEFVAQLYDAKKNKIAESIVTDKGLAHFSKLKVGNYALYVKAKDDSGQLTTIAGKKITIEESLDKVKIYLHNQELNDDHLNCNCVAFRLDDIQDFFLSPAQVAILSKLQQKNTPVTIGVIGGVVGTDQKLVSTIKSGLAEERVEIANHSWRHNIYTKMKKAEQSDDIKRTNEKISEIFGVRPTTFIPPENLFNNDTISALKENGFTHMSHGEIGPIDEPPKFQKSQFYQFPMFAYTARLDANIGFWHYQTNDQILDKVNDSLFNYGYAVVMMHPQEFSLYEQGGYSNNVNSTRIEELASLIDKLQSQNIRLMTIGSIQNYDIPQVVKPSATIPSPSCNCIAFRLDNVQDFWLNDVQNTVIDTFGEKNVPLTIGVIGKFTGDDPKAVNLIKEKLENKPSQIRIANRGWEYIDHTSYDKEKQTASIKQTNDKIRKVFGVRTSVFAPPYDSFNQDTIDAVRQNKMHYLSSSTTRDVPPFSDDFPKHIPSTTSFVNLMDDDPFLSGTTQEKMMHKVNSSLKQYGFAVVSLQPSDFAVKTDAFKNEIDTNKLNLLKSLIDDAKSGGMDVVLLERIPALLYEDSIMVPDWVKNNAGWWAEGKIANPDFIKGLEYLIEQKIIQIPETTPGAGSEKKIPDWVKNNAGWWAEGKIGNSDFVQGIQYLMQNGIIRV